MDGLDRLVDLRRRCGLTLKVAVGVAIATARIDVEHHEVGCCCLRCTACDTRAVFDIEVAWRV